MTSSQISDLYFLLHAFSFHVREVWAETTLAACFDSLKNTVTPQAYISATWTCPTRASTTFPAEQESCRVTVQNCTVAFMSYTMNCMSLVGQCRRGGAKAAILCSFPAKPGLNSQWKFKWLQELQKKPSSTLERRPYPRGLISFYKRQIWDARKWTKPTFAKGMKKQKQVVK